MRLHIRTKLTSLFTYRSGLYLKDGKTSPSSNYYKVFQNSLIIYPR